jgi:hypothetical protein
MLQVRSPQSLKKHGWVRLNPLRESSDKLIHLQYGEFKSQLTMSFLWLVFMSMGNPIELELNMINIISLCFYELLSEEEGLGSC